MKGCFSLRGVLIPVLDVRVLMSSGGESVALPNVVVVTTRNRVLGILASDVQQVVDCEAQQITDGDSEHIIAAGFTLPGDEKPVSVINADKLCELPGIPVTEEERQTEPDIAAIGAIDADSHHLMLMDSGGVPLAIDATVVHTIILNPVIENSPMKSGFCLGIIRYQNLCIPVLSLLGALGMDYIHLSSQQAFVIRYAEGYVAFTVDNIFDVLKLRQFHPLPLPAQIFKETENFIGAVSAEDFPANTHVLERCPQGHFLLIAHEQLQQRKSLGDIARMTMPDKEAGADKLQQGRSQEGMQLIQVLTVDVNGELACPVEQVAQILPLVEGKLLLSQGDGSAGLVVSREQAIPTYCLSSLLGVPLSPISSTASILVVQTDCGVIGFSVPRLITIDNGRPIMQAEISSSSDQKNWVADAAQGHVALQTGHGSRLLTLLDLQKLGRHCLRQ